MSCTTSRVDDDDDALWSSSLPIIFAPCTTSFLAEVVAALAWSRWWWTRDPAVVFAGLKFRLGARPPGGAAPGVVGRHAVTGVMLPSGATLASSPTPPA